MTSNRKRVLLCASPDLNLIDGSSVWLQTIALALAATGQVSVDLLARSTPQTPELYSELQNNPLINVVEPSSALPRETRVGPRLTFEQMVDASSHLDSLHAYDLIIVRGLDIARQLVRLPHLLDRSWVYITDVPQKAALWDHATRDLLRSIARGARRILCQSEGFSALWRTAEPNLSSDRLAFYPPVVPDFNDDLPVLPSRPVRAVYAGKFKPDWMTLEMAIHWPRVLAERPGAELVVLGDKIHSTSTDGGYAAQMREALATTPSLRWIGSSSRTGVMEALRAARVGLSWRSESMNETLEYSTKLLEYGAAGCAAIINRNDLHESLFGADYPLYANSTQEFISQLADALTAGEKAQEAAKRLASQAVVHQFSNRVATLSQWLQELPPRGSTISVAAQPKRILVAGHDLKFFTGLQQHLQKLHPQCIFQTDHWKGHNASDDQRRREMLGQVDTIICEWCLGNLAWYSLHKSASQRLFARFHAQEARSPITRGIDWKQVQNVVFVSRHTLRDALETLPSLSETKTTVIPNYLDEDRFLLHQRTPEACFTIGMVGVAPMGKRLDRAVDLLEALLDKDHRFRLRIKGRNPFDYHWILERPEEVAYYEKLMSRINSSSGLRYKIIFDPAGDDVSDWFRMVGFILSTSESESFHMSLGEGMLTGATPLIWNWPGAEELWPTQFVVRSTHQAVEVILRSNQASALSHREYVRSRYSSTRTASAWSDLLGLGQPHALFSPAQARIDIQPENTAL